MIKIVCGFPISFCFECSDCEGRGYILVDEDYIGIKIGDVTMCGENPAWLHLVRDNLTTYCKPTIYLHLPSQRIINGKIKISFDGVEQLADLEDILYDSLEHETIHYLLDKMLNAYVSRKLDSIHKAMLEWKNK